jgi:signal transduction histidine kinase/ActR/RegA family two-component response regulator
VTTAECDSAPRNDFEAEVAGRFGILPNFFRSAAAAPELIQQLWGFAKAGYLDNPMPSLFKERLFVWLSRFCPVRYCIVRHVGFLLGHDHGHASGDAAAAPQTIEDVVRLLRQPSPWQREMAPVYAHLEGLTAPLEIWPAADSELEDAIFACAAVMFVEPMRAERARRAMTLALGARRFEFFSGCLAFIRTAHYWTVLHPEIETEDDMRAIMRGHEVLARLLLDDPEADRCEMGERIFQELTALRELNERRELELAKQALEEKDRQKDGFIAVLAHELRNPLGAIRAAVGALELSQLDPGATRLVQRLDRQTTAMGRMLEDLLDASRIAFGKVSVQLERVPLRELVTEALDEHQVPAQQAGLRLSAQFDDEPCDVKADRVRLRQILDNLLSNAIKFTPAGGTIRLSVVSVDGQAGFTVQDSGVGFEEPFASQLFEPFIQYEQGRDRAGGGLGLGLAIASRLARLQGGSLSAASEGLNQGALFTLLLPVSDRSDELFSPAARTPQRGRQTILLVEDNEDMADSLADLLKLTGFEVRIAHDGPAAIDAAIERVPDVILCDLGLPGTMDGFAVARACRAEASLQSVRLIAVSGYSSTQDQSAARDAGFEFLFTKPVDRDALVSRIQSSKV